MTDGMLLSTEPVTACVSVTLIL